MKVYKNVTKFDYSDMKEKQLIEAVKGEIEINHPELKGNKLHTIAVMMCQFDSDVYEYKHKLSCDILDFQEPWKQPT